MPVKNQNPDSAPRHTAPAAIQDVNPNDSV
jgi:hypothetical protein